MMTRSSASQSGPGTGRARSIGWHSAAILAAIFLALAAWMPARAADAPVVSVTTARPAEIVIQVPVTGTLVAREEVMVNPRIAGRIITALHADIGDHVEKGALLAELDSDSLEVQLEQAKAEKIRAEAAVKQARSQIAVSQANLDNATTSYERNIKLRESGTISQSVLDQSETAYRKARASLSAAQDGLAVAQAQVRQAEARLRLARLNLSYTLITAPTDGTIAQRNARLGAIAVAGVKPMFSIIAHDEIEVEVEVLETEVNLVHPGDPVSLRITGIGEMKGKIRLIPPSVDPSTRLARLRISLPHGPALRTGLFARGSIEARRYTALTVPVSALTTEGGRDTVLVVGKDNRLIRREVRAGAVWNGRREILSGLKEGEQVLLRASPFFQEGDSVEPVPEGERKMAGGSGQ